MTLEERKLGREANLNVENFRSIAKIKSDAKAIKDADNAHTAKEKTDPEKARALKITIEAEQVRCDHQKANSEAEKVKSDAEKAKSDAEKFKLEAGKAK